ncbi:type IV secretory system conjugative DNA transfer family protein, partial [Streptobacillus moniliformis]|uniref:type IV secretory system conjugative DNA transfer family protein n=1 Tax=Streptobacillus moniliformis TaxID=34105 RepID=UPI000A97AC2C
PDISLEAILGTHSALIIRVPTIGLGVGPSRFLGSLVVERVLRYTMEHGFNDLSDPASLVVDEFQTFVGTSFLQLIPEARKFNLAITIANQTLSQLSAFSSYEGSRSSDMMQVVLGNVGNLIVQPIGRID